MDKKTVHFLLHQGSWRNPHCSAGDCNKLQGMVRVMSSAKDKWLLVEWSGGGRSVVNARSVNGGDRDVKSESVTTVTRQGGTEETATILATGRDRQSLQQQIKMKCESPLNQEGAEADQPQDFSPSASSWEPSDSDSSTDVSDQIESKRIKLENTKYQYSNRKSSKVITPVHRPTAIIPNVLQPKRNSTGSVQKNGKKSNKELRRAICIKKRSPDTTRKNSTSPRNMPLKTVQDEINIIKGLFNDLFQLLREVKPIIDHSSMETEETIVKISNEAQNTDSNIVYNDQESNVQNDETERSHSDELNRSEDNILITNRYRNVSSKSPEENNKDKDEWVPIGSGKTLIHKDQYRKVKWKSYTIATRTLLLAVFPRKILATHSLTGKRSPAFQDKPAKMCLDPKIVSDVIIEITDRFKVKENMVRTIITTKCADEGKMYRMRMRAKQKQRNTQPAVTNEDVGNQTC